jgi:hypothetical protein
MYLYAFTIFLSAFLLFQIQPMIAKMILPWFGGSASVWITAMLFFQSALLGGYLYAHWSVSRLTPRMQALAHAVLLAASFLLLPVAASAAWKPAGAEDPVLRIIGLLTASIGLPYFLLSTTSPLLQAWYSRRYSTALPYRLFGLSNLASLLGLLAYPVLIEPNVTLRHQSLGWSAAYAVFAALGIAAAAASRGAAAPDPRGTGEKTVADADCRPPGVIDQLFWLLLAGCASTLLLSVTNHLTQNVASVPFLWVLPLSLYLLSFILTFDYERLYNRRVFTWLMVLALSGMAYGLVGWNSHTNLKLVIPAFCAGLFVCCMFCHGELVKRKPAPQYLTSFYLMLSLGGALGGLLVGLAAPRVLPAYFELPITLMLCSVLLLLIVEYRRSRILLAVSWAAASAVILTSGYYMVVYQQSVSVMARNFYGGLRVNEYDRGTAAETRVLVHGTVTHGVQYTSPERRHETISYYGPGSGVYLAEKYLRRDLIAQHPEAAGPSLRVGVIGLGAGSLAAYARPGDVFRFYEINPLVEKLAWNEFTFLADCRGTVEVVLGDGRLSLEREPPQRYHLLVVDAFSGDAIPVHLLTREAIELYFRHLRPGGILALHITNTHLNLEPVVEKISTSLGRHAVLISTKLDEKRNIYHSRWALLTSRAIASPAIRKASEKLASRPDIRVWTDEYNNLFQILK